MPSWLEQTVMCERVSVAGSLASVHAGLWLEGYKEVEFLIVTRCKGLSVNVDSFLNP